LAALTRPVARREELLEGELLYSLERIELYARLRLEGCGCVHLGPRSGLLLAKSDPLRWGLRVSFRSFPDDVAHFPDIGNRDLAPAKPTDESEDGGLAGGQIHGRANLRRQDAAEMRRPERKVAVDHPHGGEAAERPGQLLGGKRAEPTHPHEADLLAFPSHLPDGHFHRRGECPHAHEDDIRILCGIFLEERVPVLAPEDLLEFGV